MSLFIIVCTEYTMHTVLQTYLSTSGGDAEM